MKNALKVAVCCDRNVADAVVVLLTSAAKYLDRKWTLHVHVVDCGLGIDIIQRLKDFVSVALPNVRLDFVVLGPDRLTHFPRPAGLEHVTVVTYARLLLHELFPNEDRMIYLDSDILIERDLAPLAEIELGTNPLAAVHDTTIPTFGHGMETLQSEMSEISPDEPYFNAGVLILDLKQLRERSATALFAAALKRISAKYADQSILNAVFHDAWKPLPSSWNKQIFLVPRRGTFRDGSRSVWHFTKKLKPWHFHRENLRGLAASWYECLDESGWERTSVPTERSMASASKDSVRWLLTRAGIARYA